MKKYLSFVFAVLILLTALSVSAAPKKSGNKSPQDLSRKSTVVVQPQTGEGYSKRKTNFTTVTVNGSGETLDKAREDAKRNALTMVVGEAIKARTNIVEEDDAAKVTSEFLSASAGFIAKYAETSQKQDGAVFLVTAAVTVYSDKLFEAVVFHDSGSARVGEVKLGDDIEETRGRMTEYICSYLMDYIHIWRLNAKSFTAGMDSHGNPQLTVDFEFGTTPRLYGMYFNRLDAALKRINAQSFEQKPDCKNFLTIEYVPSPSAKKCPKQYWGIPLNFVEPCQSFHEKLGTSGIRGCSGMSIQLTIDFLNEAGESILQRKIRIHRDEILFIYHHVRYIDISLNPMHKYGATAYMTKFDEKFSGFKSMEEALSIKSIKGKIEWSQENSDVKHFRNGKLR